MKITDISITKKGRYAIFIDGEFLFSAHEDALRSSRMTIGDEADVPQLEQLRCESELLFTKERAFKLLEYKTYTAKQLEERLERHADSDIARAVTERMVELGLVNDMDYAMLCARDLFNLRGFSARRISIELRRRGIAEHIVEQALAQFDEDDAQQKLYSIVEKKHLRHLGTEKGRARTVNALVRLGYSYGDIRSAIRRAEEEYQIEPEQDFEE